MSALAFPGLYLGVDVAGKEKNQSEERCAREDTNDNNPWRTSETDGRLILEGDRVRIEVLEGIGDVARLNIGRHKMTDFWDVNLGRPARNTLRDR